MALSASHGRLPYPIKKARFSYLVPFMDTAGTPTDPTAPDSEFSIDDAAAGDCAEELSGTYRNSVGLFTLTGAETDGSMVSVTHKVATAKSVQVTLYPRDLPVIASGTLSAAAAGSGTLGTLLPFDVTGCFIRTTGGTGGGGTGGASNQVRKIATYNAFTGAFTVAPNFETTPSTDTTYDILLPEAVTLGMLKTISGLSMGVLYGTATAGAAGSITMPALFPTTADYFKGSTILIIGGTGVGQVRYCTAYSTGRVASVDPNWNVTPDTTSQALFLPTAQFPVTAIPDVNAAKVGGTAQTGADIGSLVAKFLGITALKHWLGAIMGKQAADSTALTEIRASGAGSGTYNPATDSLEAIEDSGVGGAPADPWTIVLRPLDPDTYPEGSAGRIMAGSDQETAPSSHGVDVHKDR